MYHLLRKGLFTVAVLAFSSAPLRILIFLRLLVYGFFPVSMLQPVQNSDFKDNIAFTIVVPRYMEEGHIVN